jgi:xanthine dehydrogenase accessory factor
VGDRAYWDGALQPPSARPFEPASIGADREMLESAAELAATTGERRTVQVGAGQQGTRLFVELIRPPAELVVFGTGHDVRPVVELASNAGFRTTVVGFRGGRATETRYPEAARVRSCSPTDVGEVVSLGERTYTLVMTHNYVDDRIVLGELLETAVPYVGLMGPRDRSERLVAELAAAGHSLDDATMDRLYAPVGLDLGGGSPVEIAHAIVAELLAVRNDRSPRHLRAREGPIHERVAEDRLGVDGQ